MQIVYAYKDAAVKVDCEGPVSPLVPRFAMRAFSSVEPEPILPCDRIYLALFYNYLGEMVKKDATRQHPVFETLWHFASLHSRSLAYSPIAECRRLLASIDEAMVKFLGATGRMKHAEAYAACLALAWRFAIHGDD